MPQDSAVSSDAIRTQQPAAHRNQGDVTVVPIRKPPRLYFVNAPVDYTLIGAASIVTFVLLRWSYPPERTREVITIAFALTWVCNWPHFAATNYRLYHSRRNIMQYPVTALGIPWLILVGMIAAMLSPELLAPYFVKLYLIWSPYHFSGQTLGISLIYSRRAGFTIGPWERFGLSAFIYGTFISQTVRSEVGTGQMEFYGIKYPALGLPDWTIAAATAWMWLGGVIFLLLVLRRWLVSKRLLPPIVLLPAVTQYVWFVHSAEQFSFIEFVPFFHSAQYLFIAWSVQLKEKMDLQRIEPGVGYVLAETGRWYGLNVLFGATLFFGVPWLFVALGVPEGVAFGTVLAAVQIHHFFVDGVIWKLKNRQVSSPLMVNIDDLVGPRIAQEART
jgi:hypothetical protein